MQLRHDVSSRIARLVFAAMMALSWTGWCQAQTAAPPGVDPKTAARAELVQRINRCISAAEAAAKAMPHDTFDPAAIVAIVGNDPAALLKWVREQTNWAPYDGALRGARGVLMDRIGNSADRALLLAELLRSAHVPARIAHAKLDPSAAAALAASQPPLPLKIPDAITAYEDADTDAPTAALATQFGFDPAEIQRQNQKLSLDADAQAEAVAQRVKLEFPALKQALAGKLNSTSSPPPSNESEHYWVQYQAASGAWTDADPMTAGGAAPAHAQASTTQPSGSEAFALAADQYQTVDVRVIVERWEAGKLIEESPLQQTLRPAQLLGQRIALAHQGLNASPDLNFDTPNGLEKQIKSAATAETEWLPVLSIDSKPAYQSSFRSDGTVNPKPQLSPNIGNPTASAAKGALAAFSNEPAPAAAPPRPLSVLTAEWIEYRIATPERSIKTIRRQIFDLIGPAARAAGVPTEPQFSDSAKLARGMALIGEVEILLQPCRISNAFVAWMMAQHLVQIKSPLLALVSLDPDSATKEVTSKLQAMSPGPGLVYSLALARQQWSPVQAKVFIDTPNILTHHIWMADTPDGGAEFSALDIVWNRVAVRGSSGQESLDTAIEQGIVDTVCESVVTGVATPQTQNTSVDYATALAGNKPWLALSTPQDSALGQFQASSDIRQRIALALTDSCAVVAPADYTSAAAPTWWICDPATGQTLGIGSQGWGSEMPETGVLIRNIILQAVGFADCLYHGGNGFDFPRGLLCLTLISVGMPGAVMGGSAASWCGFIAALLGIAAGHT